MLEPIVNYSLITKSDKEVKKLINILKNKGLRECKDFRINSSTFVKELVVTKSADKLVRTFVD